MKTRHTEDTYLIRSNIINSLFLAIANKEYDSSILLLTEYTLSNVICRLHKMFPDYSYTELRAITIEEIHSGNFQMFPKDKDTL